MTSVALLPYADFLGISIVGARNGAPLLRMPFADGLSGAPGLLHGGAVAGLLEIAAVAAIDATLEGEGDAREMFKPVTVTVNFMRAAHRRETFACGRVARIGNRIANVEVSAWQENADRSIAAAWMNVAVGTREEVG